MGLGCPSLTPYYSPALLKRGLDSLLLGKTLRSDNDTVPVLESHARLTRLS